MIDGLSEAVVISGLVGLLVLSYGAFFAWLVAGIHRLDSKIERLDEKFSGKFDRLDSRIEGLTIAVSRLEGAVYHGLPEPRRAVSE